MQFIILGSRTKWHLKTKENWRTWRCWDCCKKWHCKLSYIIVENIVYWMYSCFIIQLNKLTVAVLKEYLKSVGKKVAGKKQDLVDAINDHLGL